MTGEKLKPYLLSLDDSLSSVARKIEMSPQHLNQTLSSADIKTGFLEKIAQAYNVKMGFFFDEEGSETIIALGKRSVAGKKISNVNTGSINNDETSKIQKLEAKVSELQEALLAAQTEIINLLKSK